MLPRQLGDKEPIGDSLQGAVALVLLPILTVFLQGDPKGSASIDTIMLALLGNDQVRLELMLEDWQVTCLRLSADSHIKEARQRSKDEGLLAEGRKSYINSVSLILHPQQVERLRELRIQVLGPPAAFLPGLRSDFGITEEQVRAFELAWQRFQDKKRKAISAVPSTLTGELLAKKLEWIHQTLKEEFDEVLLGQVLTSAQKTRLHARAGKPMDRKVTLYRSDLDAAAHAMLHRPAKTIRLPSESLIFVSKLKTVHRILEIAPVDSLGIESVAEQWELGLRLASKEAARDPRAFEVFCRKHTDDSVEKLAGILGKARFRRLEEIQLQIQGPGAILSSRVRGVLGIRPEQENGIIESLTVLMIDPQVKTGGRLREFVDSHILRELDEKQLAEWKRLQGDLISLEVLEDMRKELSRK